MIFLASVFLKALADAGAINDENLTLEKLNEIYGPLRTQISESIQRQERVMSEVQVNKCKPQTFWEKIEFFNRSFAKLQNE